MTPKYRTERLFADDRSFRHFVLEMDAPVLCVFISDGAAPLDPLFDVLDRAIDHLIDHYDIQIMVVLEAFAPETIARECQGRKCPMVSLYRGGRVIFTLPVDLSHLSDDFGSLCAAGCKIALEAPWNQPGVDPATFGGL